MLSPLWFGYLFTAYSIDDMFGWSAQHIKNFVELIHWKQSYLETDKLKVIDTDHN